MARSRRFNKPLAILVMDLDNFKQANDYYGHDGGDTLLCNFVSIANRILRGEDIFCRFGGEEFVALLPNTNIEQALVAAERLRTTFADESVAAEAQGNHQLFTTTVSIGVAERQEGEDIESLLRRGDTALYRAKTMGRNCCVNAAELPDNLAEVVTIQQAMQNEN
jgi:diguanylate cyclase (GGDEF)-like protein